MSCHAQGSDPLGRGAGGQSCMGTPWPAAMLSTAVPPDRHPEHRSVMRSSAPEGMSEPGWCPLRRAIRISP